MPCLERAALQYVVVTWWSSLGRASSSRAHRRRSSLTWRVVWTIEGFTDGCGWTSTPRVAPSSWSSPGARRPREGVCHTCQQGVHRRREAHHEDRYSPLQRNMFTKSSSDPHFKDINGPPQFLDTWVIRTRNQRLNWQNSN